MSEGLRLVLATRWEDWIRGGHLARVLRRCATAGWIGPPTWMQANWKPRRRPVPDQPAVDPVDRILALLPHDVEAARALDVGGVDDSWKLSLLVAPFLAGAERAAGIHILALDLPAIDPADARACFEGVVAEGSAEYGWLHPRASAERLQRATARDPAYTGPIFAVLHWCSFLGAPVLAEFAEGTAARLDVLSRAAVTGRDGRDGVLLVTSERPEEAASEAGERRLLALTRTFRLARRIG